MSKTLLQIKRKEFLSEYWERYPGLHKDLSESAKPHWGRWVKTDNEKKKLFLKLGEQDLAFSLPEKISLKGVKGVKFDLSELSQILLPGDLVYLDEKGEDIEITLLTPSIGFEKEGRKVQKERETWNLYVEKIHQFFKEKKVMQVETPYLVPSPGMEEHLFAFETEIKEGILKAKRYLPTSPEFHLKKLLSQDFLKIYEIKTCFRNEECSQTHQPEFNLLEWYRAFSCLDKIMQDLEELVEKLIESFEQKKEKVHRLSVREAFQEFCSFELSPETSKEDLIKCLNKEGIYHNTDETWDDLFFRLMLERVEPGIELLGPVILYDYPPSQCALARISKEGWAQRFEFYWNGLEIANAFDELNDPEEQLRRWREVNQRRKQMGYDEFPIDRRFIEGLKRGMPPAAGIALGLERLFMALQGISDIRETKLFPHQPLKKPQEIY